MALVLLALKELDSAAIGGLLVAALLVPHVVAAPLVGRLLDRTQRPGTLIGSGIITFAGALAASGVLVGHAPLALIVVILLVGGCCGPVITGGLTGQLAALADDTSRSRAFGLDSFFYNVASMCGPVIVSGVAVVTDARTAQLALAGSAVLGAVISATLPTSVQSASSGRAPSGGLFDTLRVIWKIPQLSVVTSASTIGQLGMGALPVAITTLAATFRHAEDSGLFLSIMAAGSLAGSILWTARPAPAPHAPMLMSGTMIGIGVALILIAAAHNLVASVVLMGIAGFFIGPFAAALFTARSHYSPPTTRTEIFTIGAGLKVTATAAGSALIGLAQTTSAADQLLFAASPPLMAGIVAAALSRRVTQAR